jgi:hypothetical protein
VGISSGEEEILADADDRRFVAGRDSDRYVQRFGNSAVYLYIILKSG